MSDYCDLEKLPKKIDIFITFRYEEAETEAIAIQNYFVQKGFSVFVCPRSCPGEDLVPMIATAISTAKLVVLLRTRTYGKPTDSYGTYNEMMMTVKTKKDQFLVLQMEECSVPETELVIPHSIFYITWDENWKPGSPPPPEVVKGIESKLVQIV